MKSLHSHIAVILLGLCYGSASVAEPLEAFARIICPSAKPQRITSAKPTKPISGASYLVARRHMPLTKQIELPSHEAVAVQRVSRAAVIAVLPLPVKDKAARQCPPMPHRSRPPPVQTAIS